MLGYWEVLSIVLGVIVGVYLIFLSTTCIMGRMKKPVPSWVGILCFWYAWCGVPGWGQRFREGWLGLGFREGLLGLGSKEGCWGLGSKEGCWGLGFREGWLGQGFRLCGGGNDYLVCNCFPVCAVSSSRVNARMHYVMIQSWLTSIDEGCTHQGSWVGLGTYVMICCCFYITIS